jgi:hypothetical protein
LIFKKEKARRCGRLSLLDVSYYDDMNEEQRKPKAMSTKRTPTKNLPEKSSSFSRCFFLFMCWSSLFVII